MSNNDRVSEEIIALEKCFRPFIIKCIQAIVQARSGNVYNTSCMSDVGARNNMMVYIEDDPEIGATIKQSLDSGFSVKPGDDFTVEIYGKFGNDLPLLEIWHFSIESSADSNLNARGGPSNSGNSSNNPGGSSTGNTNNVTDLRRTRFLERLGTLLKSIMVTTRLLPAYGNSRHPAPASEPLCFLVRRGQPALGAMGSHCRGRGVGTLVVPTSAVLLKVYVHYRSAEGVRLLRERQTAAATAALQADANKQKFESKSKAERRPEAPIQKNRPAFASNYVDYDDDDDEDDKYFLGVRQPKRQQHTVNLQDDDDEDISDDDPSQQLRSGCRKTKDDALTAAALMSTSPAEEGRQQRLQLPFSSTQTASGADLSRYLGELKLRTELDMFAPASAGHQGLGQSLGCLKDELLLHERASIQFDEFVQQMDLQMMAQQQSQQLYGSTLSSQPPHLAPLTTLGMD